VRISGHLYLRKREGGEGVEREWKRRLVKRRLV